MFFKKNSEVLTTISTEKVLKIAGLKLVIFVQKEKHIKIKTTNDKVVTTDLLLCNATNPEFITANGEFFAICSRAFLRGSAKTLMGRILFMLSASMAPEAIYFDYIDGSVIDVDKVKEAIVDFRDVSIKNGDSACTVEIMSDYQNTENLVVAIVGKRAAKKAASKEVKATEKQPKTKIKGQRIKKKTEKTDSAAGTQAAPKKGKKSKKDNGEKKADSAPDLDKVADTIDEDKTDAQ